MKAGPFLQSGVALYCLELIPENDRTTLSMKLMGDKPVRWQYIFLGRIEPLQPGMNNCANERESLTRRELPGRPIQCFS